MSNIIDDKVINYIQSLCFEETKLLSELREYANNNKIPILQKETAQLLRVLIKITKPKEILEIGTAIGYSSILMAQNSNCKITTIEMDPYMVDMAINNINKANLSSNIQVIEGDAILVLPLLTKK
ncbi:MAG TPA: O-methyltransferase, partial [Soehngenia sp.]|nr:O-methyltransferase [Soehngenia sp.]